MHHRHEEDTPTRPGVQPHEQRTGEEERHELDHQDDRSRDELLESPPLLTEVVGDVPERPEEGDVRGEPERAEPVLPAVLEESGEADLLGELEEDELDDERAATCASASGQPSAGDSSASGP